MEYTNKKLTKEQIDDLYPGAAIDAADDDKTNAALVKERTKTQNNNPRNNNLDE